MRSGVFAFVAGVVAIAACGGGGSDQVTAPTMKLSFDGTVSNANTLAPIANATVTTGSYSVVPGTIDPAFYTPRVSTSTDAQGRFTIDDQCMTKDYLEARAPGYQTLALAVACAPVRRTMPMTLIPIQ